MALFKWLLDLARESGERPKRETRRGKVEALFAHSLLVFSVIRKKKECSYSDQHPIWFGHMYRAGNKKTTSSVNNEDRSPLTISEDRRVLLPILLEAVSTKLKDPYVCQVASDKR